MKLFQRLSVAATCDEVGSMFSLRANVIALAAAYAAVQARALNNNNANTNTRMNGWAGV
jgi:hypothetical protein